MLDTEIEVFRADTRASRGITAERLASVASFDCAANPIPIVIGHPKSDSPAQGTIAGFRLEGSKLFAKLAGVKDAVVNGIRDGSILNRSMAFFGEDDESNPTPGKLAPRHLGMLGGSAPGIPGMPPLSKALAFAADDTAGDNLLIEDAPAPAWIEEPSPTAVIFTAKEPTNMDPTADQLATAATLKAREEALDAREKAAADRLRNAFNASNASAIDALVVAGKVLPAEAPALKLAFTAFDPEAADLEFGAADKPDKASAASKLLAFMAAALPAKRVPLGERKSPAMQFESAPEGVKPSTFTAAAADAATLTAQADALIAKTPGLSFEAAMERVSGGGNLDA